MHRVGIGHHRKFTQIGIKYGFKNVADHALEHVTNVLLAHEGRFYINLRELRLAVGSQIFVSKALGDLVVAIKPSHHQELFEQLRALRQREKHALIDTAGYQVVTRTLRRAFGQHRRFNVDETVRI